MIGTPPRGDLIEYAAKVTYQNPATNCHPRTITISVTADDRMPAPSPTGDGSMPPYDLEAVANFREGNWRWVTVTVTDQDGHSAWRSGVQYGQVMEESPRMDMRYLMFHPLQPGTDDSLVDQLLDEIDQTGMVPVAVIQPPGSLNGLQHPLVAAVNAEFEAAGDRWPALDRRPLSRKAYLREFEAILREHHDNIVVLIREAGGYLDLAVSAALQQGYEKRKAEQP